MKRIVIAGGTGYFGGYMIKKSKEAGYEVVAISRSKKRIAHLKAYIDELVIADISNPRELQGIMKDADLVVSSVGITKQKDGMTYMDVDYQCNKNLLDEAIDAGVKSFMYIAALNGEHLRDLKIIEAKERFVDVLLSTKLKAYIIRPSGFFSDINEFYKMAKKGRVYVFGHGQFKANPIHGSDLADFCVEKLKGASGTYEIGGPEILTQIELGEIAFDVLGKPVKIAKIPLVMVRVIKKLVVLMTKQTFYGPVEFFLTVLTRDMVAPKYGKQTVRKFFSTQK
jgi:uncharacterized protein YbjT (DUF2867 family)